MPLTLHHIAYTVSETLAGIDLIDTTWEDVTSADILLIFECLSEHYHSFQDMSSEDIGNGRHYKRFIDQIYLSLSRYLRWIEKVNAPLFNHSSLSGEELEKARNVKMLTDHIGLEWMGWIDMLYNDQPEEPQRPILPTAEERAKLKEKKEEKEREDESDGILSVIVGNDTEEKMRIASVIHTFVQNKGGKKAATVLRAVKKLGLITELPEYNLMVDYWGLKGKQPNFSEYYNGNNELKQIDEEKVRLLMEDIRQALLL